jgi:hypothetical protein
LLVGNVAVLIRERRRAPGDVRPRPNMKIVALNLALGFVLATWGLASLMAA